MNSLKIHATDDSPEINFDIENKVFEISGKSLPEDVNAFYSPVLEWLSEYSGNPLSETVVSFRFNYFNTASSKIILDILLILEDISNKGNEVKVNWYYPGYDEDMKEAGEEYSEMAEIPFEHIRY